MIEKHLLTSEQKLAYWGYGEWVEEADEYEWEYQGIQCEINRHFQIQEDVFNGQGQLNGYIILPKCHPWEDLEYHEIDADVHGGLTFKSTDEDGLVSIGFDTAHLEDETPFTIEKMYRYLMSKADKNSPDYFSLRERLETHELINRKYPFARHHKTYKNFQFVKSECESLARQAIKASMVPTSMDQPQDSQ